MAFVQMVKITAAVAAHTRRGPAVRRLSAPSHHRRRVRLLGLARARHRRRAGGADRVPRAEGVRVAARLPVPRGRTGRREPLRPRPGRRRRVGRGRPGGRDPGARRAVRPAATGLERRARAATSASGRSRRGTRSAAPAATTVRACGRCSSSAPPTSPRSAAPARGRTTPGCCSRWPGSARRPPSCSARTGGASGPARPLGPAGLRVARRGMRLASELGLPLVTVIDTAGRGAVQGGRGGRAGRRDRPFPGRSGDARRPDRLPAARRGRGRRGARAAARRPGARAPSTRWLSPLPPGGRLGDRCTAASTSRRRSPRRRG